MASVGPVQPVELLIGVIAGDAGLLGDVERRLQEEFGPVECRSDTFDFDATDYYRDEMGKGLIRVFFAFERLISPEAIADAKLMTNRIEAEFLDGGRRRVNLDPGYMDFYKLVLASVKFMGQKIYLGKGVYADPTLYYDRGWRPYDWGFPDFRSGRYYEFLTAVRRIYKAKIRGGGRTYGAD